MSTHKNGIKLSRLLINFAIIMIILSSICAIDATTLPSKMVYALTIICYVASIILGGLGITGEDMKDKTNYYFDWQAKTGLIGIIFFIINIFL